MSAMARAGEAANYGRAYGIAPDLYIFRTNFIRQQGKFKLTIADMGVIIWHIKAWKESYDGLRFKIQES